MKLGTNLRSAPVPALVAGMMAFVTSLALGAGVAEAQQSYAMFGAFARGEAALVKLPLVGDVKGSPCTDIVWNNRNNVGGIATSDIPGPDFPVALTLFRQKVQGCVRGGGNLDNPSIVNVEANGAFTIPTDFFEQQPDGIPNETLVPIPNVVNINTTMPFAGPRAVQPIEANCDRVPLVPGELPCRPIQRTIPDPSSPGNVLVTTPTGSAGFAAWRRFSPGAFASQSGRAAVDFTFCPGNKNCTAINQGQGGLVRYKNTKPNGAAGFGGTMSVILSPGTEQGNFFVPQGAGGAGGGVNTMLVVGVQIPPAWTTTMTGTSGGQPTRMFTTPMGGTSTLPFRGGDLGGKGYAAIQTGVGPFGGNQAYAGFALVQSSTDPGRTGFVRSVTGVPVPLPGSTNRDHQNPFTTGTVTARNIIPTAQGGGILTLQMKGNDGRTANGAGNIQMVAGGIRTSSTGSISPIFTGFNLQFVPVPEPGTAGLVLAGAFGLIGLAMRRNRAD